MVEDLDGATLSNNRKPPPHIMKGKNGKVIVGENDTLRLLQIYHLHLLKQINNISEVVPDACVWVPLSECIP